MRLSLLLALATAPLAVPPGASAAPRPAHWAEPVAMPGLPNLHRVSPMLYRGAQLEKAGFESLRRLNVGTIISLRALHKDKRLFRDVDWKAYGIERIVQIRFNTWHAEEEDVVEFLRAAADPALNRPVFVHCLHGADRTGVMCAVYRMVVQGWDKQEAIREFRQGGFGFHGIWKNLPRFLEKLDVAALKAKLAR